MTRIRLGVGNTGYITQIQWGGKYVQGAWWARRMRDVEYGVCASRTGHDHRMDMDMSMDYDATRLYCVD